MANFETLFCVLKCKPNYYSSSSLCNQGLECGRKKCYLKKMFNNTFFRIQEGEALGALLIHRLADV